MPKLVILTHGLGERAHVLSADRIETIGRTDDNTFPIAEASVSARHCEVQLRGNELYVRDLNSTNGTYIMGQRITEGVVRLGQVLRVGQVDLRLQVSVPATSIASLISKAAPPVAPATSQSNPKAAISRVATQPLTPIAPASPEQLAQKEKAPLPLQSASAIHLPETADAPVRKYQVLLVDDSVALIETMGSLFNILSNSAWEIHTASTPDRALAILQQASIDLAVLDLAMPLLDGVQLLGMIRARCPNVKTAILTGEGSTEKRAECLAKGADAFIEKPTGADGLKSVFNVLNDLLTWLPNRPQFHGKRQDIGLHDVLQMECLLRNSAVLQVRHQQLRGLIYIEHGNIVHAATFREGDGMVAGEKALYQLLALPGGQFQALPFKAPSTRTVESSWETLLMEAARQREETAVILRDDTKTAPVVKSKPANGERIEHAMYNFRR